MSSFWVVERFEHGKSAGYWDGASSRSFVPNINEAIQFVRKQDAFWATKGWHWNDTQITEHVMVNMPVAINNAAFERHIAASREVTRRIQNERVQAIYGDPWQIIHDARNYINAYKNNTDAPEGIPGATELLARIDRWGGWS